MALDVWKDKTLQNISGCTILDHLCSWDYTLPSVNCCQHRATTIYRSTEVAADTSIRPTCFSEAYYTAPIKVRQLLVLTS
ncbi:hypothetical protein TNCV_1556401 [Trichonephila clavipes]|nr:hypothetical protein TNCV_1556401 [Trichonephila clavipes]